MDLKNLRGTALEVGITFSAGSGFALFGYDQGVFGGLLGNESFIRTFNRPNAIIQGQITATYDLGCFFGAILTMFIGERLGRKKTIYAGCGILIIGAILQCASYSLAQMIVGRFVAGLGNGMNTSVIPVWQSETSKAHHRGRLVVLQLVLNQSVSWRFPLAFQCFFAILTVIILPVLPESPRWLAMQGRYEEAKSVVARLLDELEDSQTVTNAYDLIANNVLHEMEMPDFTFAALFHNDALQTARRILLGAGTQFMQQWGGINIINYYLPVVFASVGVPRRLAVILSGCNAINLMISTCIPAMYIETFGRKRMMLWGALVQGICFVLVAAGLGVGGPQWSIVAIFFIFFYYTTFGLTWIAVPWLYPAEVNTQRMRNAGAAVATATNWINNYIVVLVTPVGISTIGWRYYIIYAAMNFAFVPIVWYFYIETAKLSLEEIDTLFEHKFRKGAQPQGLDDLVHEPKDNSGIEGLKTGEVEDVKYV
ncbi:hexose carrier protein [Rhexocercosporidium sp. MPI-PUGE-AT-0058]|nr:hexose carrier protein [Rhexocercosporidium sp. MPI-PUGE-AT-0058]